MLDKSKSNSSKSMASRACWSRTLPQRFNSEGEVAQLVSGGEFYVNATQNGEDLELNRAYLVFAPTENTGGPDMEMELFKIKEDGPDGKDLWVEAVPVDGEEQVDVGKGDADGGSSEYSFLTQEFGWSNIDRWYSDPRPKTTIHVDVPDGWDDQNSSVFLSYDGENTLARFDTYDESTELFSEHYGLIPIGLEVHVIFMTKSEEPELCHPTDHHRRQPHQRL